MRFRDLFLILILFSGCASASEILGTKKLEPPPEFNQKILLQVSDEAKMHQAPSSNYDVGDLEAFHVQHTLPIVIEDAFKEIFGQVEMVQKGPVILHCRKNHFVIAYKTPAPQRTGYYQIADPAKGLIKLKEKEFIRFWIGELPGNIKAQKSLSSGEINSRMVYALLIKP